MGAVPWQIADAAQAAACIRALAGEIADLMAKRHARDRARLERDVVDLWQARRVRARLPGYAPACAAVAHYLRTQNAEDRLAARLSPALALGTDDVWQGLNALAQAAEDGALLDPRGASVAAALSAWLNPAVPPEPARPPAPTTLAVPALRVADATGLVAVTVPPPPPRPDTADRRVREGLWVTRHPKGARLGFGAPSGRPSFARRYLDPRPWFPAARWDAASEGWIVPGTRAFARLSDWLDRGAYDTPKPDRPARKPRPTREESLAAWRETRRAQREQRILAHRVQVEAEIRRARVEAAARRGIPEDRLDEAPVEPFAIVATDTAPWPLWLGPLHTPHQLVEEVRAAYGRLPGSHDELLRLCVHVPASWAPTGYHLVTPFTPSGFFDVWRFWRGIGLPRDITPDYAQRCLALAARAAAYIERDAAAWRELAQWAADPSTASGAIDTIAIARDLE